MLKALALREKIKNFNTTLVSVLVAAPKASSVLYEFQYNACVGSRTVGMYTKLDVTNFNTTLVSVLARTPTS